MSKRKRRKERKAVDRGLMKLGWGGGVKKSWLDKTSGEEEVMGGVWTTAPGLPGLGVGGFRSWAKLDGEKGTGRGWSMGLSAS